MTDDKLEKNKKIKIEDIFDTVVNKFNSPDIKNNDDDSQINSEKVNNTEVTNSIKTNNVKLDETKKEKNNIKCKNLPNDEICKVIKICKNIKTNKRCKKFKVCKNDKINKNDELDLDLFFLNF